MSGDLRAPGGTPRVLHIHGSLAEGNPQAERCVRLLSAFGARLRHSMVAADGDFSALAGVAKGVPVERHASFPPLSGMPLPGRLQRVARAMVDYHLVHTYGRGAIGAALAHTAFGEVHALPPLIHHEDGSDESQAQRRRLGSMWLRRLGLGRAAGLVVPSETMEAVALVDWQQPLGRVKLIPDGVDAKRFTRDPQPDAIARLLKRPGERWIGSFARHDGQERLQPLLETLARVEESWHLVIVGDGPRRGEAEAATTRLALDHRVHFVRAVPDRAGALALFDIVAAPGGVEPLPLGIVEAMAAGRPVVGLESSEALAVLSSDNAALGNGDLERLAGDDYLRQTIGAANRAKAAAERGQTAMIAAYRRLYASAMKRDTI